MLNPDQLRIARSFGIPTDIFATALHNREGGHVSLNSAVDEAHQILKRGAKKAGVKYAALLSACADKELEEMNAAGSDSDAGDEGEGDIENGDDDAGSMKSMQDMKTASPAPSPSPIDRTTGANSPRYLAKHGRATMRIPGGHGDRLLLNVSAQEFNAARSK